ncbi:hypothetical protein BsWGS_25723 [Bradybaena similaris]
MSTVRSLPLQRPSIPVKPDVKLKHLPFYDVLAELMKPSRLIPRDSVTIQAVLFDFRLTPQHVQDITMSRDFRPGAKCEYTVQVQVRFCLLETTCEQTDAFPSKIHVRVNSKPATLPNIPTNNPNVEQTQPGRPVDITSLCKLSPTVSNTNTIVVTWAPDSKRSFCMAVYLVRKLTCDILLTRLKQAGHRRSDHTKALIKEKLAQDPDSGIVTTSLSVSLTCPLGKMRIQTPCRGCICTHLQCFDALTYLKMNERKPTWMCPVCNRPCPYDKLIIDGYLVEICQQSPSCLDIVFNENGSWTPMNPQKENANQVVLATATSATSAAAPAKAPVIDLTLDSSDDNDDDCPVIPSDPVSSSVIETNTRK